MNNQPAIDRSFVFPLILSGLSVIGIVVVLIIGRRLNAPAAVADTPSATPFQYLYLGTEPAITTPLVEGSEIPLTEDPVEEEDPFEEEDPDEEGPIVVPGQPATPTALVLATATNGNGVPATTPAPTDSSVAPAPLTPNTYDDTHEHITYDGWEATVSGSTTLHVSSTAGVGNTVYFSFVGEELHIRYQSGATLGHVQIFIVPSSGAVVSGSLDESNENGEWQSVRLPYGTYDVEIVHTEGGPVNIDQIIILSFPATATPTVTPTP